MLQEYVSCSRLVQAIEHKHGDTEGYYVKSKSNGTLLGWASKSDFDRNHIALGSIAHFTDEQQKVIAEIADLKAKLDDLTKTLTGPGRVRIPIKEKERLERQSLTMEAYLNILEERVACFEEPKERDYEVWMEGYSPAGDSSGARLIGKAKGRCFGEAVRALNEAKPIEHLDILTLRVFGCRLHDNEIDARKWYG